MCRPISRLHSGHRSRFMSWSKRWPIGWILSWPICRIFGRIRSRPFRRIVRWEKGGPIRW